ALPNNRAMNGPPGASLPHNESLALVGDPDPRDIANLGLGSAKRLLRERSARSINLFGIVLNPSGVRIELTNLTISPPPNPPPRIKHEHGSAGSPLIDREDKVRHREYRAMVMADREADNRDIKIVARTSRSVIRQSVRTPARSPSFCPLARSVTGEG